MQRLLISAIVASFSAVALNWFGETHVSPGDQPLSADPHLTHSHPARNKPTIWKQGPRFNREPVSKQ
jgi:hypothetical protein